MGDMETTSMPPVEKWETSLKYRARLRRAAADQPHLARMSPRYASGLTRSIQNMKKTNLRNVAVQPYNKTIFVLNTIFANVCGVGGREGPG